MKVNLKKSVIIRHLSSSNQRRVVYDKYALSPTLQASMGLGGGCIPLIIVKIGDKC